MKTDGKDLVHDQTMSLHGGGLTKREYFAAIIMAGLSANTGNMENTTKADALIAVNAADQLIQALNEQAGG